MPGAILRSGSIVSAWKIKRTSSPRCRKAFATASATRTSRRLPAWMLPETLMPLTTTCGPAPKESATLSAQPGMGMPVAVPVSFMRCSNWGRWWEVRDEAGCGALARDLDVDDLVLRRAAGSGDRDLLAHLLLEHGAAHGRGVGKLPAPWVGLVGAHDLERPLLAPVHDPQGHAGPEVHGVVVDLGRVDHLGAAKTALELADPALQQVLFVLSVVVLGVLGDVTELARLPD